MLVRGVLWQGRSVLPLSIQFNASLEDLMHSFSPVEVKKSRNASSLLPIKLALMISDLDLFGMMSGHVCVDMTLAS